ncbi:MAG TPA: rhodanese, partial [Alcanivorax sp.]|nr:rhodanese [Alcanivorax sp.]
MALKKSVSELVAAAEARIERLTPEQARQLLEDPDVRFVDIRDVRELKREGTVPGALHAPRGMLEFWVDPDSPYHKADFASGQRFV